MNFTAFFFFFLISKLITITKIQGNDTCYIKGQSDTIKIFFNIKIPADNLFYVSRKNFNYY